MILQFKNVIKKFGDRIILNSINFSVSKGQIVFILGQSGTGKSVLLKNLVGLMKPEGGEILLENENIVSYTEKQGQLLRKRCGMVFQNPALFDSMTLYENIAYGLRRHFNLDENEIQIRVKKVLKSVHLDEEILPRFPREISYGMQKRVSLARTLILEPEILLFDEPTTGLDPVTTRAVNRLIKEVSDLYKTTSLVVSHDMQCAVEIADKIVFLDKGQVIFEGSIEQVSQSSNALVKEFFAEVRK